MGVDQMLEGFPWNLPLKLLEEVKMMNFNKIGLKGIEYSK
jgi:hypothetical protein